MTQWTPTARQEFEDYCQRMRESLSGSGADPLEVIDDLKRHVDAEIASRQLKLVTEQDVRSLVAGMGAPPVIPPPSPTPAPPHQSRSARIVSTGGSMLLLFIGVLLPAGVLGFEFCTHFCGEVLFDPIPSYWHLLMVALVPVGNLLVWQALRREELQKAGRLAFLNALALGVGIIYSIIFLPLAIPGMIAVIFYGLGFLPLTPYLALTATLILRRQLRRRLAAQNLSMRAWRGLLAALALLVVAEFQEGVNIIGKSMAVSSDPASEIRGVKLLRAIGSEKYLLRDCYPRPARFFDLSRVLLSENPVESAEEARTIYFRVIGRSFNAAPPPRSFAIGGHWSLFQEDFFWWEDSGLGGESVAGKVKGLSMKSSRLDGVVQPDDACAYMEWTMEFNNQSRVQREARAVVVLPPGGVVSRLTLWVNGEEREAAFAGRSQVREAYKKVAIVQRRDPVLVTTCGPDRVLVQCFPVPPQGGTMKIRLGITAPIALNDASTGVLRWPMVVERNYNIPQELKHHIWLDSPQGIRCEMPGLQNNREDGTGLHGEVKDADLLRTASCITVHRDARRTRMVTSSPAVLQSIRTVVPDAPDHITMVIDGSHEMQAHAAELARAWEALPASVPVDVVLASDSVQILATNILRGDSAAWQRLNGQLGGSAFVGGQDNLPALTSAWDLAAGHARGMMVWVHGPQPLQLSDIESLRQRFDRHAGWPRLVDVQSVPGPNCLIGKLDGFNEISMGACGGDLVESLASVFKRWNGQPQWTIVRERLDGPALEASADLPKAGKHVARLWALGEIRRLAQERQTAAAISMAAQYQLVTPLSGAVVLENQQQYADSGLKPVDPATVPTIPEPSTWILLILGSICLVWQVRRNGRRQHA